MLRTTMITAEGGATLCALVVHVIFNRVEPRNKTVWFLLLVCLPICLGLGLHSFYASLFVSVFKTLLIFIGSLLSSLIIYRLSPLHPLYGFPGPVLLRISRLASFKILFTGKQHEIYQQLHEKYGPYVRTGPNHLHISDAQAIPYIMNSPRCLKSERYNAVKREDSHARGLLGIVDPKEHSRRRRLWDRGLNTSALKGYQPLLTNRINQFVETLRRESSSNESIDLAKWIAFFSLDFMGDLAWGGVFHSMEDGNDVNGLLNLSQTVTKIHETAGTIPWTRLFYEYLPVSKKTIQQLSFAKRTVLDRIKRGCGETPDLFMYLLGEHDDTIDEPLSLPALVLETSFALIAGTDTSAMTLANSFFYLLSYPDTLSRLTSEIDALNDDLNPNALAGLPYLNAVLNETLRLQPVVPNGVQRVLLPGPSGKGVVVDDRYIPPRTNLQISPYCVQRDPLNFSPHSHCFWPDRWLPNIQDSLRGNDKAEFRHNEQAFFPFSYGPTACAGKSLALMEMRAVLSTVLSKFELAFADGWNPAEWEHNLKDFYTLRGGPLPIVLVPRKVAS
ncbi:cytochrome P450 [Lentinula edodes]|uniref:Cytochrome P450 n=1 Tax=Lentinula lateritia TaxID=40482 RepID=A0A9W9A7J4_9AGAR|nr:cytochrome P450 [Lentinula edodes]